MKKIAVILLIFILFSGMSCSGEFLSQTSDNKISKQEIINKVNAIHGIVVFPDFKTKASINEVSKGATIHLSYPANHTDSSLRNTIIATGLTDSNGQFIINPNPSFVPVKDNIYILEANKRIGGVGNYSISLRTYLQWNGINWVGITYPNVLLNTKTTALVIIADLNPSAVSPLETIKKMQIQNGIAIVQDINSYVTANNIERAKNLVEQALQNNLDIVGFIQFKLLMTSPSGLSISNLRDTTLTLNWNQLEGSSAYNIYKNNILLFKNINATSKEITGLTSETLYDFKVSALNIYVESPKSTSYTITTLPSPPNGLTTNNLQATSVNLNWNPVSGSVGYNFYKDWQKMNTNPITNTSYIINGLFEGTTYYLSVTSVNSSGIESPKSDSVSTTTLLRGNEIFWFPKTDMPSPTRDSSFAVFNNKLYVFGGDYRIKSKVYNPSTNSWSYLSDVPGDGVVEGWAGQVNGKIYMAANPWENTVRIYDPLSDTWSNGPDWLPSGGNRLPASVTIGNDIYVIGGGLSPSNQVSVYNTVSNTWSTRSNLQKARWGASAVVYNNKIYLFGGMGYSTVKETEVYDPNTNTWQYLSPNKDSRYMGQAVVVNNKIYYMGGFNGSNAINTVEMYDPLSDKWHSASSFQAARYGFISSVINNKIYIAGGGNSNGNVATTEEATITN